MPTSFQDEKKVLDVNAHSGQIIGLSDLLDYQVVVQSKSVNKLSIFTCHMSNHGKEFGIVSEGDCEVISKKGDTRCGQKPANKIADILPDSTTDYVDFTLINPTARAIPLIIPSVMNPNLSPFSKSGVSLKVGQEILFKYKGRTFILLVVDQNIAQGAELNVPALIKDRKKELGL